MQVDGVIRRYAMSKPEMRNQLASLSFAEKVRILEKLRNHSLAIAAAGLRRPPATKAQEGKPQFCTRLAWEPCGCGKQPRYHCMYCCLELTAEQITAAKQRGCYAEKEK